MREKKSSAGSLTLALLREDQARVLDAVAKYRLYEGSFASAQYYVEVTLENERSAAYLGEDAARAMSVYKTILDGTVTPCTLQSIVEDLFA